MSFNENLDSFLTGCRENAVMELQTNDYYTRLKNNQKDLFSQLEELISPDVQKVLDTYVEATTDVQRLEYNTILLCGLTVSAELHKRFDPSTDEYKAFAGKYLTGD